jgi:hypothetical protein
MPAGWTEIGALAFIGVKFAGYTAAGYQLRRSYDADSPNPFLFGTARTLLGIVVGVCFATLILKVGVGSSDFPFYVALLPIRLAEWSLTIWFFFGRNSPNAFRLIRYSIVGSLWSYLLDVPAMFAAFVVPGGMWIC